ncbi:MAG: chaperone NapD [Burkholderiaceae bacterium]
MSNICGCLVHAVPESVSSARLALDQMPGVETHAQTTDGRFVVVVEDTEQSTAAETIMAMHQIPGIVSVTLSYHHFDDIETPANDLPASSQDHATGAQV